MTTSSETIAGLGTRADFVAPVPGVDPVRLQLSFEETMVLASIGKAARISQLLEESGLGEAKTLAVLLELRMKGAIHPAKVKVPPPVAPPPVDAASVEEVDLPPERKKEVLDLERALPTANHFSILGLLPGASLEEVKQAYYDASRRYHPDRFYGKNLGSFRGRIDRIFKRISEAYQVLSDAEKRAAYEKAHPELAAPTPPKVNGSAVEAAPATPSTPLDPERAAERKARLLRHPYLAKQSRTGEMLARAKALLAKEDFGAAMVDLQMVLRADPRNAEVQALITDTRTKLEKQRGKAAFGRGLEAEKSGQPDKALEHYREALRVDENYGAAAYKAAQLLLTMGGSEEEARHLARKAVELDARSADAHALLAKLLVEHDKASAKKYLERALKLSPEHPEAKKVAKKLRWPF